MSTFVSIYIFFFLFKQKTAYEMRISDWSSDVCSSDLEGRERREVIGRDRCGARPPREIADQLRPIGSFQRRAFAGGDHARIGQRSARDRHIIAQLFQI